MNFQNMKSKEVTLPYGVAADDEGFNLRVVGGSGLLTVPPFLTSVARGFSFSVTNMTASAVQINNPLGAFFRLDGFAPVANFYLEAGHMGVISAYQASARWVCLDLSKVQTR